MQPDSGLRIALVVILATLLVAAPALIISGLFVARLLRNSARDRAVLAAGEPAQAVTVSAADTGVTVNDCPPAGLTPEVRPAARPPFVAETTLPAGRFQNGIPGSVVRVGFDPADPSRVAAESSGGAPQTWQRP